MLKSLKGKFKLLSNKDSDEVGKDKNKRIENIIFLIVILIISVIIINNVWSVDNENSKEQTDKVLADAIKSNDESVAQNVNSYYNLQSDLEDILETIQGVGKVKVLINYAETSTTVAMYNETKTESTTEEQDTEGGVRNVTQTDTQKEIAYTNESGDSAPITEKIIMPTIEGAIITAQGASNATIKSNIISATQAVTGLAAHKIQVFQMQTN